MADRQKTLDAIRKAIRSDPRFREGTKLKLDFDDGVVTIAGIVDDVANKKSILRRVAKVPPVVGIVDQLRVMPAQQMGDGEIRTLVRDALLQESALAELKVFERVKDVDMVDRIPVEVSRGEIGITVNDGVVTLDGVVPSLAHKRLAGVLAWWVPGSCDVVNALEVADPEAALDAEITDVVRMALEKDPFVDAQQIRVYTSGGVVRLTGLVPTQSERHMAECDAWYVFGVEGVINRIEVRPVAPTGGV